MQGKGDGILLALEGEKMIALKTHPAVFISVAFLLLGSAFVVFRLIVRRGYRLCGQLTLATSAFQLIVFAILMSFPYLFNPPEWTMFWLLAGPTFSQQQILGMVTIVLGVIVAFGTMAWFGLRRAFGLATQGLITTGPYRLTRNPQILGGYLMVIGATVQWPSWYSLIWIVLYGLIGHWMILTEEEHLQKVLGEEYKFYCERTPRYLIPVRKSRKGST
ncbi:MAG: methyltransferase family protein [Chloroflexota bacterium]